MSQVKRYLSKVINRKVNQNFQFLHEKYSFIKPTRSFDSLEIRFKLKNFKPVFLKSLIVKMRVLELNDNLIVYHSIFAAW